MRVDTMPTPNALFGALQPSVVFPVTSATSSPDIHPRSVQQQAQIQQHPAHQQRLYSHASHPHNRHPNYGHHPCQQGPDSAVMEFITKIGQIIVKARTVSPAFSYNLAGTEPDPARSTSSSVNSSHQQQQNLDMILQDMDIWRNSTPVHVNILHSAQHVLLERWVISFTPAATASAATSSPSSEQTSGCMKPAMVGTYHATKTKQHLQHHLNQCTCPSPSTVATASSPRDTTDLVLLLQSLYTQIRSLPLQNCLTSFDDETRLAKADLAYSVTSANEDITQPRQDKTIYCSTQPVVGQQSFEETHIPGSTDEPYTEFATSLRTALPLEFVQAASLKVINFEASHMHWGCVRVTGMYDESVGGRIAPENFQDLLKAQKQRHHRTKQPSTSSMSDLTAKASRRLQKEQRSWNSVSQPVKDDSTLNSATGADLMDAKDASLETNAARAGDSSFSKPPSSRQPSGQPPSPNPGPEEPAYTRLQSLKRSSDRLFSAFSPSRVEDPKQPGSSAESLEESLLARNDADREVKQHDQEEPRSFRFPPPPSPPLSIPLPRKDSLTSRTQPSDLASVESHSEKTPTGVSTAQAPHRAYPPSFQYSPPLLQQQHHYHHYSHHPFSTSPLAQVITRRRSSRLSIVMNCNDDSPDPSRAQSQDFAAVDEPRADCSLDDEQSPREASSLYSRRDSLQDQRNSYSSEMHLGRPSTGQSPSRNSYLRRSSLTPSSVSHGDLFGSLVGSYEESILSGRMSTLPSKPLIFAAQIGVLANQDYKDCPPKLRCPKHVQLEFPAVFYDYESSINHQPGGQHLAHQSHSHSHSHSHSLHHPHHSQYHQYHPTHSSHPVQFRASHSFGNHGSISPSSHPPGSFASSPVLNSYLSSGGQFGSSYGSGPTSASLGLTHNTPAVHDDPVLPYVGNLDLDSGFRGSRRFARMPGGMRIPLRGQVQVVIKNPNKTAVKVFLVPYDFTDMPEGTKTFLRQKYYSTGPGMGPSTPGSSGGGGTLRYAIHLQFCCPAPGYVYLYRSIRVVFANRVPDGKESLRVVLEGLGLASKSSGHDERKSAPPKKIEERYVKMRKGEVSFTSSKRKKDHASVAPLDDDSLNPSTTGLGLQMEKALSPTSGPAGQHNSSLSLHQQRHTFDGQLYARSRSSSTQDATARGPCSDGGMSMAATMAMDMDRTLKTHPGQQSLENGHPFAVLAGFRGRDLTLPLQSSTVHEDEYKSMSSSVLVGTQTTPALSHYLQPLPKLTLGSPSMSKSLSSSSSSSNLTSMFPKESSPSPSPYLGSPTTVRKQQSQILGI
ncbi:hypothetical protein KVV02_007191 [Mortierella alpina]|uniref:Atos-like conserved domain-containing protein n=1 Tax=Mortierella alpina TaxID=64518 RepID=A0A9P8CZN3_MORAP|nr:hypothetical protein KVV02_007191 [Mortierella alpina]